MYRVSIRDSTFDDIEKIYSFERKYIIEIELNMIEKWDGAKE